MINIAHFSKNIGRRRELAHQLTVPLFWLLERLCSEPEQVKRFNTERGFAFIGPDDGGKDVFGPYLCRAASRHGLSKRR